MNNNTHEMILSLNTTLNSTRNELKKEKKEKMLDTKTEIKRQNEIIRNET